MNTETTKNLSRENDREIHRQGVAIAKLLGLRMKRNCRYNTSWGEKTASGLALSVKRAMDNPDTVLN